MPTRPEVILPAYGCPDLISACIYAGVKPILVDLEPDSCWMSLAQIENRISDNTVAILAVRFLGIPERMEALRHLCAQHKLTLIEDSAQGFPLSKPDSYWRGDLNILSFGRGKPVNLLAGGAVLSNNAELAAQLPTPSSADNSAMASAKYHLKAALYNALINPVWYGLVSRLPGLNIGETIYKPLSDLRAMPEYVKSYLTANITAYRSARNVAEIYREKLMESQPAGILDLALRTDHNPRELLLRYPLLLDNKQMRDSIDQGLISIGSSKMYQRPLVEIEGVPDSIKEASDKYPNARSFADRLLTLPTHQGVTETHITRIIATLTSYLP